jgi:hypothetical protein
VQKSENLVSLKGDKISEIPAGKNILKIDTYTKQEILAGEYNSTIVRTRNGEDQSIDIQFKILKNLTENLQVGRIGLDDLVLSRGVNKLIIDYEEIKGNRAEVKLVSSDAPAKLDNMKQVEVKDIGKKKFIREKLKEFKRTMIKARLWSGDYSCEYSEEENTIWVLECSPIAEWTLKRECTVIYAFKNKGNFYLQYFVELEHSLLIGMRKSKDIRWITVEKQSLAVTEKLVRMEVEDMKIYPYKEGFVVLDINFGSGLVNIWATKQQRIQSFSKKSTIKIGMFKKLFVDFYIEQLKQKIQVVAFDQLTNDSYEIYLYDVSNVESPKLEKSRKNIKFVDLTGASSACSLSGRIFAFEDSSMIVKSLGFEETERVVNYEIENFGFTKLSRLICEQVSERAIIIGNSEEGNQCFAVLNNGTVDLMKLVEKVVCLKNKEGRGTYSILGRKSEIVISKFTEDSGWRHYFFSLSKEHLLVNVDKSFQKPD